MKSLIIKTLLLVLFINGVLFTLSSCEKAQQIIPQKIVMTFDSKFCIEKNFEEIKEKFEQIGFTNVDVQPESKGWFFFRKDGNVKSVSINGLPNWNINDLFDSKDHIVIKYWSSGK